MRSFLKWASFLTTFRVWGSNWILVSPSQHKIYFNINLTQECGYPDTELTEAFDSRRLQCKLNRITFPPRTKPWNIHLSIHLYAPFDKIDTAAFVTVPKGFLYPKLWFRPDYDVDHGLFFYTPFSYQTVFHLVVVSKQYGIANRDKIVNAVVCKSIAKNYPNNEVVYLLHSENISRPALLSKNFKISAEEMLSVKLHIMDHWSNQMFVPQICQQIENLKRRNFHIDTNSVNRFQSVFLEIWLSHLGNQNMTAVHGHHTYPDNLVSGMASEFQFCARFSKFNKLDSYDNLTELNAHLAFEYKSSSLGTAFSVFNP